MLNVCRELPEIQFLFAGTGSLEKSVNKIKNIKNVEFQTGKELEILIRKARFSIYPSEWYENCPFSVIESQMYGTQVLGANIGKILELISVGETGELFESGNDAEMKTNIWRLWANHNLIDRYIGNCNGISFDTIEEYGEKLMKVYKD